MMRLRPIALFPGLFRLLGPLLLAVCARAFAAPPMEDVEFQIKAEFIERFADYVEWPADSFASKDAPFNVCIEGDGPLRPHIESILGKGRIKGRGVIIVPLKSGESAAGCHILYIAPSESDRIEEIIKKIGRAPVLTIGDTAGFGKRGVHINLFIEGTHVRFAINAAAAKANGLSLSVKLLVLARASETGG